MATPPQKQQAPPPPSQVSVQHMGRRPRTSSSASSRIRTRAAPPPPRRVASGLSARDSDAAAAASGFTGAELAAPKWRRSISGSTDWRAGLLLPASTPAASARKAQARRARLDDAAGIGLLLFALERTWRKTVAGASKMFVEGHRTNHVLLISDMV